MTAVKTNKSFSKRLKVTKNGKVLARKPGQDHFRAKKTGTKELDTKRWKKFNISQRDLKHFLPHS